MRQMTCLVGVLFSTALAACGGDGGAVLGPDAAAPGPDDAAAMPGAGTDGAVVAQNAFSSSACKKETVARNALARIRTLNVIDSEAGLQGLRCVAWDRAGAGELKLDLYNFDAACGAIWNGDGAVAADGTLDLHVDNPSCRIASCGTCLYDWSFDLHVDLPADHGVALDVAVDSCQGQQATAYVSAAIGAEVKGIRCTLASYGAMTWQAESAGTCGQAGMPCIGSLLCGTGSLTSTGTCADGLVCDSSAAPNQPVCFVPCTTVADCPRADVYTCQAGLCRPTGLGL